MSDYLRIARVYLHGTSAAVWCFMFVCLLAFDISDAVSAFDGEFARKHGGMIGGVLSRKSYLAMFAYFNACVLGVLLRDNLAQPSASVLPHYRKRHLLVTTFIALCFLGIPMFALEFVGTSDIAPTSVGVIFLTCLAAGLWTLHHPLLGFLAVPFLALVMVPASSSPELAAFLAGTSPATSAALAFLSLLTLWALAWRLLKLNEDMFEYTIARVWGDLFRGRGGQTLQGLSTANTMEDCLAAMPADQRASLERIDSLKKRFTNLKQVENLSGYSERSLWQRMQLWRLGTAPARTSASLAWLIVLTLIIIPPCVFILRLAGSEHSARFAVLIFSVQVMANPVNLWHPWFMRLHRLGLESLRPRTRQEFVRELGLALLWDITQCWFGGVLCMAMAAALWAPELLQVTSLLLFILVTGVGQLCAYAMIGIWLLKQRPMAANVALAFCPFMAIAAWMLFIVESVGVELNIAIASVLAAVSVATIALAYRRWCRVDFD